MVHGSFICTSLGRKYKQSQFMREDKQISMTYSNMVTRAWDLPCFKQADKWKAVARPHISTIAMTPLAVHSCKPLRKCRPDPKGCWRELPVVCTGWALPCRHAYEKERRYSELTIRVGRSAREGVMGLERGHSPGIGGLRAREAQWGPGRAESRTSEHPASY